MSPKQWLLIQAILFEQTKCQPPKCDTCKPCQHRRIWSEVAQGMLRDDDYPADSFVRTFGIFCSNVMFAIGRDLGDTELVLYSVDEFR